MKGGDTLSTQDRIHWHDSLFDMMRHPSTYSVAIQNPSYDLVERSSLLFTSDDFPNLRHMDIDLVLLKKDVPGLKSLVSRAPNLASLDL
jgi:hypothetical protein